MFLDFESTLLKMVHGYANWLHSLRVTYEINIRFTSEYQIYVQSYQFLSIAFIKNLTATLNR